MAERSTNPKSAAKMVPPIKPIKTAIERIKPFPKTCTPMIKAIVTKPNNKFVGSPKLAAAASPPPILVMATGIKVKPMTVITVPVTNGGNKTLIFEKMPAIRTMKIPAAMIAP